MPLRILDLRLVLDRGDRVRVNCDGRELVRHDSAADALRQLADIFDASTKTTAETVDKLRAWSVRALGGGEA